MRLRAIAASILCAVCLVVAEGAVGAAQNLFDKRLQFHVRVFPDRSRPDHALDITDFRVNETIGEARGVTRFVLRSKDGTFDASFETVSEVELRRFLGVRDDMAEYDARIVFRHTTVTRTGTLALRVLRGLAGGVPWHLLLATREDRGAGLFKIVFVE